MTGSQVKTNADACPATPAELLRRARDYLHAAEDRIRKTVEENSGKEDRSDHPEMTLRRLLLMHEEQHSGAFYDFLLQLRPGSRDEELVSPARRCMPDDPFVLRRVRTAGGISGQGNAGFRVCAFLCFRAHAPPSAAGRSPDLRGASKRRSRRSERRGLR